MIEPTAALKLTGQVDGPALDEFMAWWGANPDLTGFEARFRYFPVLLAEVNRLRAERDQDGGS